MSWVESITALGSLAAAIAAFFSYNVSKKNHELTLRQIEQDSPLLQIWFEPNSGDPFIGQLILVNTGRKPFIARELTLFTSTTRLLLQKQGSSATESSLFDIIINSAEVRRINISAPLEGTVRSSISLFRVEIIYFTGNYAPKVEVSNMLRGPYVIQNDQRTI